MQFWSPFKQLKGVWNNFVGILRTCTPTEHISGQRCSLFKQQRPCCSLSLTPSQATWIQSWRMACTEKDRVQRFSKYRGRQYSPDWKLQVGAISSSKSAFRKISFEFLDCLIWNIMCKCHLDDCRSLRTLVQEGYYVGSIGKLDSFLSQANECGIAWYIERAVSFNATSPLCVFRFLIRLITR